MAKEIIGSPQYTAPQDDLYFVAANLSTKQPGVIPSSFIFNNPSDVRKFGAVDDGVTDVTAAVQAALDTLGAAYIPPGDWHVGTVYLRAGNIVRNDGHIIGTLRTVDQIFNTSNTYIGGGALSAGITSLPGNFATPQWQAAAAVNGWAVIELQYGSLGSAASNQFGWDLVKVSAASGTALTIDRATRWAYPTQGGFAWQVSLISGVAEATGTLAAGASSVPVDNTAGTFAAGDIVLIVNKNGTDTYWGLTGAPLVAGGDKAYFERVKVKSATTTTLTLEDNLAYTYTDYWVVKPFNTANVTVQGGKVDQIWLNHCSDAYVFDAECDLVSFYHAYRYGAVLPRGRAGAAVPTRVIGATNSKYGYISGANATGASSSADNGAVKFLGCQHLAIYGLTAYDTTATAQGVYPCFGDFYNTPWACWSHNVVIQGGYLGTPKGGAQDSILMSGTRNLRIKDVTMTGGCRIINSVNPIVDVTADHLNAENLLWGSNITGKFKYMLFDNCEDFVSIGAVTTGPSVQNSRCLYIRNTATRGRFIGYQCLSLTAGDRSVYINDATNIDFIGCGDNTAHTLSFETTVNTSGIRLIECRFLGGFLLVNPTVVNGVLTGSKTFNWGSIASAAAATTTVTVTGAALGDRATATMSLDLQGLVMTAYVSAADTVTVVLFNPTGGAIDLASGTLSARVTK